MKLLMAIFSGFMFYMFMAGLSLLCGTQPGNADILAGIFFGVGSFTVGLFKR